MTIEYLQMTYSQGSFHPMLFGNPFGAIQITQHLAIVYFHSTNVHEKLILAASITLSFMCIDT